MPHAVTKVTGVAAAGVVALCLVVPEYSVAALSLFMLCLVDMYRKFVAVCSSLPTLRLLAEFTHQPACSPHPTPERRLNGANSGQVVAREYHGWLLGHKRFQHIVVPFAPRRRQRCAVVPPKQRDDAVEHAG